MLRHAPIDCDAQEGKFLPSCATQSSARASTIAERYNVVRWYIVVFNNKFNIFFGLNFTYDYKYTMFIAWRYHFPIRK